MTLRQFYDWQTAGGAGDVSTLVRILEEHAVPWCMIGGLAVNHWANEPMATADVELVIATDRLDSCLEALAASGSLNCLMAAWMVAGRPRRAQQGRAAGLGGRR